MKDLLLNFSIDSSKGDKFEYVGSSTEMVGWYIMHQGYSLEFKIIFDKDKRIGEFTDYAYFYSRKDLQKVYNGFVVNSQKTYDMLCDECKKIIVEQCQVDKNLGQELAKRNIHVIKNNHGNL